MESIEVKHGIIEILNTLGHNILWIAGDYYDVSDWRNAEGNGTFHQIIGKRINKIIENYAQITTIDQGGKNRLIAEIDKVSVIRRNYEKCAAHPWIIFSA